MAAGSLSFGVRTLAWANEPNPFAITFATGLALLVAGWLVGALGGESAPAGGGHRPD